MPNRRILINVVRFAVLAVVIWGISRAAANARASFVEKDLSWQTLRWRWLVVSAIAYQCGLFLMGCFWYRVLHALHQRPGFFETMRAYYIGHLGKYVPGKAMVFVLRAGLIRGVHVDTVVAGISVFIETFTMMAVGAFWAVAVLLVRYREITTLRWLAIGLMIATVAPTLPPLFRILVRSLRPTFQAHLDEIAAGYTFGLVVQGWLACTCGWALLAVSFWATLKAIPYADPLENLATIFPVLLASVALATVLGFVSLLPGGVGVREWALDWLMVPQIGEVAALAGAIVLRLVWLLTELLISVILYFGLPSPARDANPSKPD